MRILQIIDTLEAGGAERMAVNYANALTTKVVFSGMVVTRREGPLLTQLSEDVSYLFLNKKGSIDLKALLRLKSFVQKNEITIIQAHSTSFFIAFLLKLIYPSIQLIWHDHYGDSEFLDERPSWGFKVLLPFFAGIISVNQKLKDWAKDQIHFNNTVYLPNFTSDEKSTQGETALKGINGKRIVCLANLRVQKNHFLLIEVAVKLRSCHPDWTFHLVGKDNEDLYATELNKRIIEMNLNETVFIYGSKPDINTVLKQSTIAILTSKSEGLPVALLEYGLCEKPVVVTAVGEIDTVIQNGINGFIVPGQQPDLFYNALIQLVENEGLRVQMGKSLYQTVRSKYSEKEVIKQYLFWLQTTIMK